MWNLVTVCTQPKERPGRVFLSNELLETSVSCVRLLSTNYGLLGSGSAESVSEQVSRCVSPVHLYTTCSYTGKLYPVQQGIIPQCEPKVMESFNQENGIHQHGIIGCFIQNSSAVVASFHRVPNAPETSAPGRPSLVGVVASVRVARWGCGMAMDAVLQDCDTESTFSLWWTLAWHFIYGSTYSWGTVKRLEENAKLSSRRLWMFLAMAIDVHWVRMCHIVEVRIRQEFRHTLTEAFENIPCSPGKFSSDLCPRHGPAGCALDLGQHLSSLVTSCPPFQGPMD